MKRSSNVQSLKELDSALPKLTQQQKDDLLLMFCGTGPAAAVEALLKNGASPAARDDINRTPLIVAAMYGQRIIFRRLKPLSMELLNVQDDYGNTACIAAARNRHYSIAADLRDTPGIDLSLADYSLPPDSGRTAKRIVRTDKEGREVFADVPNFRPKRTQRGPTRPAAPPVEENRPYKNALKLLLTLG